MSHYITANDGEMKYELSVGISSSSIDSIWKTGFDIYMAYGENGYFGSSGPGNTIIVDNDLARSAYFEALAWAKTLQKQFPERFEKEISEVMRYNADFNQLLKYEIFGDNDFAKKIEENLFNYDDLSENDIKSSFSFFGCIIEFTYNVFNYTINGKTMELFFG